MAYTMEQFVSDTHKMVIEDAIKQDPEAVLKHFDAEQRLNGLDPATIEAWLASQKASRPLNH